MIKKRIQSLLQSLLGFENYLFLFSLFIRYSLKWNKKEGDFLYFLSMLDETDHVLDIGANIGIMTALIAKNCPKGMVHAFEPVPENFRVLKRIVAYHKYTNVHLYQLALGDSEKQVEIEMPYMNGVRMQGLSHVIHDSIDGYNGEGTSYKVVQKSLDQVSREFPYAIAAMKLDVENYEHFVLTGGKSLLKKNKPLIYCELWDNENRMACFKFMQDLGYEIKVLVNNSLQDFEPGLHNHQNFFFIPPAS